MKFTIYTLLTFLLIATACQSEDGLSEDPTDVACVSDQLIDTSRGVCDQTLSVSPTYTESISGTTRSINTNNIPNHMVGLFGNVPGHLNPNAIAEQAGSYQLTTQPQVAVQLTPLLSTTAGPQYSFGILLNGVELDPVAAEPFPHEGIMSPNVNWEWNLEATNVRIGLDCNNAHVQPSGKYHYHAVPTGYLAGLSISSDQMTLVGYAADGFPIYYKYAYTDPSDSTSAVIEMTSSYRLKSGDRPGDGINAPCDTYNGVYSNDYEYVEGLGTLDEANGRFGLSPEYPNGTYYYLITETFPHIPRYFRGTPSQDFKLGAG